MKFVALALLFSVGAYATSLSVPAPIPPIPPPPVSAEDVKECLANILPPNVELPETAPTTFQELKALIQEKAPEFRAKLEEHFKKAKEEAEAAGGEKETPQKRDSESQQQLPPLTPPPRFPHIRECLKAAVGDAIELPENMPPNLHILHMAIMGITGHLHHNHGDHHVDHLPGEVPVEPAAEPQ